MESIVIRKLCYNKKIIIIIIINKKKKHRFIDERGSTIVYNGLVKFNLFSTIVLLV